MIFTLRPFLVPVTALGCAVVGGVFFAFSTFVMKALGGLPPAQGMAAMQSINVTVINPLFMSAFLGTALASLLVIGLSLPAWNRPGVIWCILGGALYIIGTFGVTMAFNVPRNNALAALDPASAGAAKLWADYLTGWTAWNHVRIIASLAAAGTLIIAALNLEAK